MRALGFLPARFCMIAECLAGVLTCCFPNMHGPPYPKTGSGALPKTLVRPMSAVEGCAGRALPWQPRGHSVNPGFPGPFILRAKHGCPTSKFFILSRPRGPEQPPKQKKCQGSKRTSRNPPPPIRPEPCGRHSVVVILPTRSRVPPPAARCPPPPWRPIVASLARCMFLSSVLISCQRDWHEFQS